MEVEITVEELQKRKIMVATPMYGGMCGGQYTKSCIDLGVVASRYGVELGWSFLFNESLITRARNYLVDEFLRSNYTHLMFIDSDIGFDPQDVLTLAAIADPDSDKDIVCGAYPKKTIAWEKIKRAVDKGVADDNPNILENYVGDFVFNPVPGTTEIRINEPVEVLEGGTGFMMIQKHVFEKFGEAHPELLYKPDHVRTANFDGSRQIHAFFDTVIDPKSNRYLSEDYMFCQWSRDLDIKVWMCPWMQLKHMGSYIFGGDLASLASVGVSATADAAQIGKKS
tara:strand:- start:190 stop:1035 length:846 start_codon:yes stop_codon:yes gene_type:complete